jgi:hypothetical protein
MIRIDHLEVNSFIRFPHRLQRQVLLDPSVLDRRDRNEDSGKDSSVSSVPESHRGSMVEDTHILPTGDPSTRRTRTRAAPLSARDLASNLANNQIVTATCGALTFEGSRYSNLNQPGSRKNYDWSDHLEYDPKRKSTYGVNFNFRHVPTKRENSSNALVCISLT